MAELGQEKGPERISAFQGRTLIIPHHGSSVKGLPCERQSGNGTIMRSTIRHPLPQNGCSVVLLWRGL